MDGKSWPAVLTEVFGDVVRNAFRPNKYEYLSVLRADLIKMSDQLSALLEVTADFDNLLDVMVGSEFHRPDVDLNHVFQEVLQRVSLIMQPSNIECLHLQVSAHPSAM